MEATEILLREDLKNAIESKSGTAEVQQLIRTINNNLDKAEALF